jgi:hypothetical protein
MWVWVPENSAIHIYPVTDPALTQERRATIAEMYEAAWDVERGVEEG